MFFHPILVLGTSCLASPSLYLQGVNPKMHYSLQPTLATTGLYHITEEGVIIAKTDRLRPFDRHILEVRS